MKQKRVALAIILVLTFSLFLVNATEEEAYDCLKDIVGTSCEKATTTEKAGFSLLALSYNSSYQTACKNKLISFKKENCWGTTASATCDLKSTALAVLALDYIGQNTDNYTDWLEAQKQTSTTLDWFLEIDQTGVSEEMRCEIYMDDANTFDVFTINADKTITGTDTTCIEKAVGDYFLKIDKTCYEKIYSIYCDKNFLTTLIYTKQGENTFYLSTKTNKADAGEGTEEQINSVCIGDSECDYEGSLWAAFALRMTGKDIEDLLPYLNAEKTNNLALLPQSLLYRITAHSEFLDDLLKKPTPFKKIGSLREPKAYWLASSSNNEFYDTALALLGLQRRSLDEKDYAKTYLLAEQDDSGCWNSDNLRDTAFILYSAWPRLPSEGDDDEEPTCSDHSDCSEVGSFCDGDTPYNCTLGSDGCLDRISEDECTGDFYCDNGICIDDITECENECDTAGTLKCFGKSLKTCGNYDDDDCLEWGNSTTCEDICEEGECVEEDDDDDDDDSGGEGEITDTRLDCVDSGNYCVLMGQCDSGNTLSKTDYKCYWEDLGDVCCKTKYIEEDTDDDDDDTDDDDEEETECEGDYEYNCRVSCEDDEVEKSYDCDYGDKCCAPQSITEKSNWLLIILLVALIILTILAIVFRNQLKIWLFRIKSKFKFGKGPSKTKRPPMPPPGFSPRPLRPRQIIPRGARPVRRRPAPKVSKDTAFDETMKKLKDMTK